MKDQSKPFFNEAYARLSDANKELFRPEEDIVSYLVCKNAHFAVENYLKGFLIQNSVDISNFTSIDSLYQKCVQLNPKFKKIELKEFSCGVSTHNSKYCNEVAKVSNCFHVANDLDTFFREEKLLPL